MPLFFDWGNAEAKKMKIWKPLQVLNHMGYFDNILCTHWYWQDLARGIAKCHFSFTATMFRQKKEKKNENVEIVMGPQL